MEERKFELEVAYVSRSQSCNIKIIKIYIYIYIINLILKRWESIFKINL